MSILIKIIKDGKPESHKIERLPVFLGSGREKGMLQLDDSGKASKQFVIYKKDTSLIIKKLVSKPLIVNGQKITREAAVLRYGINKIVLVSCQF